MISLLLQNSAGQMSVGLAQGDNLLFDSNVDVDLAGSLSVEAYVSAALTYSKKMIDDVGCVFVDIGCLLVSFGGHFYYLFVKRMLFWEKLPPSILDDCSVF